MTFNRSVISALDNNKLVEPATAHPTLLAFMNPLFVSTPTQDPDLNLKLFTSQF